MFSSNPEQERRHTARLEVYRLAVQAGFYNESPGTIPYKGYAIAPMDGKYHVMQNGVTLIQLGTPFVAKVWITCRVDNTVFNEAHTKVRSEG